MGNEFSISIMPRGVFEENHLERIGAAGFNFEFFDASLSLLSYITSSLPTNVLGAWLNYAGLSRA